MRIKDYLHVVKKGCLLFSFCFIMIITGILPVTQASSFNEAVQDVMTKLSVNETVAIAFLQYVDDFVTEVQNNFTNIASHQTPRYKKKSLIEETLEKHFDDHINSEVQVSSLNKRDVSSFPVQVYLNRLYSNRRSKLAISYKTVKLHFDKSYFSMGPIEVYRHQEELYDGNPGGSGIGDKRYEFKLDMWQLFEGCYRDKKHCYREFTKKGFYIVFVPSKSGWSMEIFAITADKPVQAHAGDSADDWRKRLQDKYGK